MFFQSFQCLFQITKTKTSCFREAPPKRVNKLICFRFSTKGESGSTPENPQRGTENLNPLPNPWGGSPSQSTTTSSAPTNPFKYNFSPYFAEKSCWPTPIFLFYPPILYSPFLKKYSKKFLLCQFNNIFCNENNKNLPKKI